jgi:hypothetical protein
VFTAPTLHHTLVPRITITITQPNSHTPTLGARGALSSPRPPCPELPLSFYRAIICGRTRARLSEKAVNNERAWKYDTIKFRAWKRKGEATLYLPLETLSPRDSIYFLITPD